MAKKYSLCKVCKSSNFLNYAGLCKKCNREGAGSAEITKALAQKQQQKIEAQVEKEKQRIEDLNKAPEPEETTDEEPEKGEDEKKEDKEGST